MQIICFKMGMSIVLIVKTIKSMDQLSAVIEY